MRDFHTSSTYRNPPSRRDFPVARSNLGDRERRDVPVGPDRTIAKVGSRVVRAALAVHNLLVYLLLAGRRARLRDGNPNLARRNIPIIEPKPHAWPMDILIQSLLDKVRKFNASLHIRYYSQMQAPGEPKAFGGQNNGSHAAEGSKPMTSYVIIRREYSYLEPLIRSMFEDAPDVNVFIDRRSEDRREPPATLAEGERRSPTDRRASTPMLDILINVES